MLSYPRRRIFRRRARRGVILVLVAISLVVILAFVAIALDGGSLLERRRHAQSTADAAAMAAAENLFRSYPKNNGLDSDGEAAQAALAVAAANGIANDGATSIVTVRTASQNYFSGSNAGAAVPEGYVEVTVEYNQGRYFSGVLASGSIPISARAVARGEWEAADVAIHVLDLHRPGSLSATGESFATVSGAKIIVNSDAPDAAATNGGTITAPTIDITGGTVVTGSKGGFIADINYDEPPEPDPLRHIPQPNINGMEVQSNGPVHISNGTRNLQPGTYRGGISVTGQGNLNMAPGVYYMDGGGFDFSGQGSLNAQGVMIFNAPTKSSEVVSITGTGSIVMSPPTTGIYKGLTLFQARYSGNTMTVSGGGYMDIIGTFYTAGGTLKVSGGGDSKVGSQYISRFLEIVGNGGLYIDYNKPNAIPRRVLQLIE
jgi:Flp pilus assembly protein TadG